MDEGFLRGGGGSQYWGPRMRHRRDVGEDIKEEFHHVEEEFIELEEKAEEKLKPIAEVTHMEPWMVLAIIATAVVVLIGVGIWCAWRFMKKKRPKGQEEVQDDEKDLVGNEEEVAEEIEEIKANEDFKGKIHYKLEYDFTTQELKVTVCILYLFNRVAKLDL